MRGRRLSSNLCKRDTETRPEKSVIIAMNINTQKDCSVQQALRGKGEIDKKINKKCNNK
jgi:hypothetical protein